jgi:hypothetical protein
VIVEVDMAARMRKSHQDDVRAKIQVSNLLTRVNSYAMGDLTDEDISPNRLNAIKLLLAKALPDLSSIEITGDPDSPLAVMEVKRVIVDPNNTDS